MRRRQGGSPSSASISARGSVGGRRVERTEVAVGDHDVAGRLGEPVALPHPGLAPGRVVDHRVDGLGPHLVDRVEHVRPLVVRA